MEALTMSFSPVSHYLHTFDLDDKNKPFKPILRTQYHLEKGRYMSYYSS